MNIVRRLTLTDCARLSFVGGCLVAQAIRAITPLADGTDEEVARARARQADHEAARAAAAEKRSQEKAAERKRRARERQREEREAQERADAKRERLAKERREREAAEEAKRVQVSECSIVQSEG